MTNMMKKLNLKDFSSESLKSIRLKSLHELLNVKYEDVKVLGETNANKFMERVVELKSTPMYDYQIVGAIGFSNIAVETWKKILNKIHLQDIIDQDEHTLYDRLINIKGIGPNTAACICAEREEFYDDLISVCNEMPNVTCTTGITLSSKSIRFTGVRDEELCNYLCSLGYDANGNAGVTRNTDILIVPYDGFSSSKTSKCGPGTTIVDIASFKANMDKYLA